MKDILTLIVIFIVGLGALYLLPGTRKQFRTVFNRNTARKVVKFSILPAISFVFFIIQILAVFNFFKSISQIINILIILVSEIIINCLEYYYDRKIMNWPVSNAIVGVLLRLTVFFLIIIPIFLFNFS